VDTCALALGVVRCRLCDEGRAVKIDHTATCGVLGPDVRVSAMYVRAAICNRAKGHTSLKDDPLAHMHREYDPHTFHVRAEWPKARNVVPNRRKIGARGGRHT
jgi:hypothetical protein